MSQSENFPGGLWINGVRVDVAGRIAPKRAAQSKETAGAGQPTKAGPSCHRPTRHGLAGGPTILEARALSC